MIGLNIDKGMLQNVRYYAASNTAAKAKEIAQVCFRIGLWLITNVDT